MLRFVNLGDQHMRKLAILSAATLLAGLALAQAQTPPSPPAGRADQNGGGAAETLSSPKPTASGPIGGTADPAGGNRLNDRAGQTSPATRPNEEQRGGMNTR
jgi:hypothetical protein